MHEWRPTASIHQGYHPQKGGADMKRSLHAGKKQSEGFGLNLFSDDELSEIHLATLEVLQYTGTLPKRHLRSHHGICTLRNDG